jgi:hypothetical protein
MLLHNVELSIELGELSTTDDDMSPAFELMVCYNGVAWTWEGRGAALIR